MPGPRTSTWREGLHNSCWSGFVSPAIVGATWQKEGDWAALDRVITLGRFCCVIVTLCGVPPPGAPGSVG